MLIHRHDEPLSDAEWRAFLAEHDFGELIAPGVGRDLPIVVPTHFVYDGDKTVLLHLAKPNPVWEALAERPRAMLSVFGAYTYIPGHWNQDEYGVPTSYYAAVQLACDATVIDEPARIAAVLERQLAHFQPEGPACGGRARREPLRQAAWLYPRNPPGRHGRAREIQVRRQPHCGASAGDRREAR
jgi:transcriptional regulator